MKFSKSLLNDKEIGKKVFNNSIEKSKNLLTDIFGLDFKNNDPKIKKLEHDDELYKFSLTFNLNDREILAEFLFEEEKVNIVQEVLKIHEVAEKIDVLKGLPKDYKEAVNKIKDLLEIKYGLNFLLLDPDEKDENIKNIKDNCQDKSFTVEFIHDDYESKFKAIFLYKASSLTVIQHKEHTIYLE